MAPTMALPPPTLLALSLLSLLPLVLATPNDDRCPAASELVYSPFKPWFAFPKYANGSRQLCWNMASCTFIEADEARKQQFAATALVMGLIPPTLKDIAWPERRLASVSRRPHPLVETLVRALGLEPVVVGAIARAEASAASPMGRWAWGKRRRTVVALAALCAVALLGAYAALALVEIYSKRAALGCPYPIWALTWYFCGLAPAAAHTAMSRMRGSWVRKDGAKAEVEAASSQYLALGEGQGGAFKAGSSTELEPMMSVNQKGAKADAPKESAKSPVQGADEWWVVQLIWVIYYIAGTLIFTSIMAVTVIELFVWVMICFAVTGASKLLAFFICLAFEDKKW
ncbi:hypothetical protein BJ508DRAFT_318666 [Neofusicoccum parvum]|uniref:Uncharacterized protein n=1 Tax=Neofusicoccum parvum TaxID=310453 RepID=A0ACB5SNP5_9PEZI|nr:hypothetical protein BJ508DRAFT_318666 [Neofusicoccum parvum]